MAAPLQLTLTSRSFNKGKPVGKYARDVEEAFQRPMARAATNAFRDAARGIQTDGRAAILSAGLGPRFARQFRVFAFPRRQFSLSPALRGWHARGWRHSRIGRYANIFAHGGTISAKGGGLLWIPLPTAPRITGGRRLTPAIYNDEIGPLVRMRRTRRPILAGHSLQAIRGRQATVAQMRTGARNAALRKNSESSVPNRFVGRKGRRTVLVPMFVGVSSVTIDKRVDIDGVFRRWNARLPDLYAKRLNGTG